MDEEQTIVDAHLRDLKIARQFISDLIIQLDLIVNSTHIDEEITNQCKYIWGDKENAVSSLTKLVGLLVKVIPIEQKLNQEVSDSKKESQSEIDDDDDIIEQFIKRYTQEDCYGEDEY